MNTEAVVVENVVENVVEKGNVNTNATNTSASTSTTTISAQASDFAKNINVHNPTWDLFIVLFFVIGALLYGMSLGKDRIVAIMVSIYMALAVVNVLPSFVFNLKINEGTTFQITAFLSVFVILFFLLSRQAVLNALGPSSNGSFLQVILFSVLHIGLLISVTMSYLPPEMLQKFSPFIQQLFTAPWYHFGWVIAPIVAMAVLGKSREE